MSHETSPAPQPQLVTTEELNNNPLAGIPEHWLQLPDASSEADTKVSEQNILPSELATQGLFGLLSGKENTEAISADDNLSPFAKFTKQAQEGRFDGKTLGERVAERRNKTRTRRQNTVKADRIAQLQDELSGASSTIAVSKDGQWAEVKSMRTYKTDALGKKRVMKNEEKLAYEEKVKELYDLMGYAPDAVQESAQSDQPSSIASELQIQTDMSEDEFTAFLDRLSDQETETIKELMKQDAEIEKMLNDMSNNERKQYIIEFLNINADNSSKPDDALHTVVNEFDNRDQRWYDKKGKLKPYKSTKGRTLDITDLNSPEVASEIRNTVIAGNLDKVDHIYLSYLSNVQKSDMSQEDKDKIIQEITTYIQPFRELAWKNKNQIELMKYRKETSNKTISGKRYKKLIDWRTHIALHEFEKTVMRLSSGEQGDFSRLNRFRTLLGKGALKSSGLVKPIKQVK